MARKHLFSDLSEMQDYYPFQDNKSMYQDLKPTLEMVEEKFIRDEIDPITWQTMLSAIDADEPDQTWLDLTDKARRAAANLTALHHIAKANVIFSSAGLLVAKTTNTVPASEFRTMQLKWQLHRDVQHHLDQMIKTLEDNTAVFTDWAASTQATKLEELIITTASEFDQYYSLSENHYIFRKLISPQKKVISSYVTGTLGKDFLAEVLPVVHGDNDSDIEPMLNDLKIAVANLTFAQAVPRLQAQFGPEGIAILDDPFRERTQRRNDNDVERLRFLTDEAMETGVRHLRLIKGYLDEIASPSRLATYFNSENFTDPDIDLTDPNMIDENDSEEDTDHYAL